MDTKRVIEVPLPEGIPPDEMESLGTLLRAVVELHAGGHAWEAVARRLEEEGWTLHTRVGWIVEARRGRDFEQAAPTWARLITEVFQADPLVCRRCGGPLKVVADITDSLAIRQILDHLDLTPPEKPPPDIPDVVRVPVDEEGREIAVQPA